ncbi:MAG: T9SS type A sorting domain-containing protein [Caldisericaceae bacterium]|nr:T9SS type A sorting domain-containing protein [Caldisericaceae bacterium]
MKKVLSLAILLLMIVYLQAQKTFPWPVEPFHESHEITGTFCEFRDTGSSDHFHNGTDIPKADGQPVYPVKNGTIVSMSSVGSNAYVRVNDIAYVHITPNSALSVGDNVTAGKTVLGTIYPGMGHVHFTYGYVGSEKNAMLPNQGFTPLEDPWPPIIRYVHFYQNNSLNKFPSNRISGAVDIVVKVDEQNGPPSSSVSRRNNGTYKIGYKIFSADTSTLIYSPSSTGVRFQFDTKPSNSYVHNVYFDQLSSTTSHVYILTNKITADDYWDTTELDSGKYVVMVFTEDTRGNTDTAYVQVEITGEDAFPPPAPVLRFTRSNPAGMEISWYPSSASDLKGYRYYFSWDLETWNLHTKENELTAEMTDTTFNVQSTKPIWSRLSAVDDAYPPNESNFTDVYGTLPANDQQRILIVDGFDRTQSSGSWHEPEHWFAAIYGQAMAANDFGFDCAANDALLDGSITLSDYDAVFWFLGDESTADETFSADEQQLVKNYLEAGGRLFVSGSEIAWDLDQDNNSSGTTAEDEQFLHLYLKADYNADDSKIYQVTGLPNSIFEGIEFAYGQQPYEEDYPDAINPYAGSVACLKYKNSNLIAAVQYEGTFGESTVSGKLVYLAFPFETIDTEEHRNQVMSCVLDFFFNLSDLTEGENEIPEHFEVGPNFPNPFNNSTTIRVFLPAPGRMRLSVFDVNGRLIQLLKAGYLTSGKHRFQWNGTNQKGEAVASGLYFYRAEFEDKTITRKMLLVK